MNLHAALIVAVTAGVTILLRLVPFLIFGGEKETPPYVVYLGKVLPYAIIGMLVVFCLKNVRILTAPHGIPELIACVLVVLLHVWKRSTLLSIVGGTVCYMLLIQFVF